MKESYTLSASLMQVSLAGVLSACSYFLTMENQTQVVYFPAILLIYAPLVYLLNRLFLRRERTIIAWILWNVALCALLVGSVAVVCSGWPSGGILPVLLFTGLATLRGAQLCHNPPKLSAAILWLEINVVVLAVFMGIWATTEGSLVWCSPVALGAGAALLAVISHRMNGRMGGREWLLLMLAFAFLGGVLWLLVNFLAAPTGQGVVLIWSGFLAVLNTIGGQIQRFLAFMTSFLKPEHYEEVEMADLSGMNMDTSANDTMAASFGRLLAIFVIVAVVIAVVAALIVFGRIKLGRPVIQAAPKKKEKRNRPSLLSGIKKMLEHLMARLRLWREMWTARNTELGTYYSLVRLCRRTALRQQPGDTPGVFLNRLEEACSEQETAGALADLRLRVDRVLYSGQEASSQFPGRKLLKQNIKRQIKHNLTESIRN
jgi:hypothetical protein